MDSLIIQKVSQLMHPVKFSLQTVIITASKYLTVMEHMTLSSAHTVRRTMETSGFQVKSQLMHPVKFSLQTAAITASNYLLVLEYM